MILVDELIAYPPPPQAGAARYCGHGKLSCPRTTTGSVEEVQRFAAAVGLQRRWCPQPDHPLRAHDDRTPAQRAAGRRGGAVFRPAQAPARRPAVAAPGDAAPTAALPPSQGLARKEGAGSC